MPAPPSPLVRCALLAGSADLLQHPHHVEVVVCLTDLVALDLEHLGGLHDHVPARRGDITLGRVQRPSLGSLPRDLKRDSAIAPDRTLDPLFRGSRGRLVRPIRIALACAT